MNITSLLALLQAAASILTLAQSHTASVAFQQEAVNFGSNAVQMVTQAAAPVGFQVPKNDSAWPNVKDLMNAPYIDTPGHWAPLGATVQGVFQYASFGDLNHDGVDDAAIIVNRPTANGTANYFLAAMLNQGGIMFNIADAPLGATINITSHAIASGTIILNGTHYTLLGNSITQ